MNFLEKIFGILVLGNISVFAPVSSMHLNSSDHRIIEKQANSFADKSYNCLIANSVSLPPQIADYLVTIRNGIKETCREVFRNHLDLNRDQFHLLCNPDYGQMRNLLADNLVTDLEQELIIGINAEHNDYIEGIQNYCLNTARDSIKKCALQELEKFIINKRTWGDTARMLTGLTLLGVGTYYLAAPSIRSYIACHYQNNPYGCINLGLNYITLKDLTLPFLGLVVLGKDKLASFYKYFFQQQNNQ